MGWARCYAARGSYDEATATLLRGLELAPESADIEAELARLAFDRGDYDEVEQRVARARELNDEHLQARWLGAELYRVRGQLDEANGAYKWFVDYYNAHDVREAETLYYVGRAAGQYARWNRLTDQFAFLVNELYPDALAADPSFWPAHLESGLLFLEKYNEAEAQRELSAALRINPSSAEVNSALAQLALQRFNLDEAKLAIARALEINPRSLEAHRARGDWLLANLEFEEAAEVLERARRWNGRAEATLGRLGAAYLLADGPSAQDETTRFGRLRQEVDERNPRAGEFYDTLASALGERLKFPAAEQFYREALKRMPQLIGPRTGLGMLYMRMGREDEARQLLDEAFEIDPFNVRVSNTLKVLEVLDEYETLETAHFIIKFDGSRDGILAHYVARHLEEAYPRLCAEMGFEPSEKSLFEIFSRARNTDGHGWFSARMVGLPYIGTVGACVGKMVALASPTDGKTPYNWARVVEHEFIHVINLQQTNFNIPHWYTEALAVLNEGYPRPQVWNQLLVERVPKGEMFNLDTINLGFARPKSGFDWQMAYCQAELYAEYLLKAYGEDALAQMLAAYANNLSTREALAECFGVEQEDFEQGYQQYVRDVVNKLSANPQPDDKLSFAELERAQKSAPEDVHLMARLARAHLDRKAYPEARRLARQVRQREPAHPLAGYVVARLHLLIGDVEEARTELESSLDRESPHLEVLSLLAALHQKGRRYDEAAELYELGAGSRMRSLAEAFGRVYLLAERNEKLQATWNACR